MEGESKANMSRYMNQGVEMSPEGIAMERRIQAITAILEEKKKALLQARAKRNFVEADKVLRESRDLLTELRYVNPDHNFDSLDLDLISEAKEETEKLIKEKNIKGENPDIN